MDVGWVDKVGPFVSTCACIAYRSLPVEMGDEQTGEEEGEDCGFHGDAERGEASVVKGETQQLISSGTSRLHPLLSDPKEFPFDFPESGLPFQTHAEVATTSGWMSQHPHCTLTSGIESDPWMYSNK